MGSLVDGKWSVWLKRFRTGPMSVYAETRCVSPPFCGSREGPGTILKYPFSRNSTRCTVCACTTWWWWVFRRTEVAPEQRGNEWRPNRRGRGRGGTRRRRAGTSTPTPTTCDRPRTTGGLGRERPSSDGRRMSGEGSRPRVPDRRRR